MKDMKILDIQEEFLFDRGDKIERCRLEIHDFKTKITVDQTYERKNKELK